MNTKITLISSRAFHITALNENALLVSYGNIIDAAINEKIIALHEQLTAAPFGGMIESVPAYASLAVFYDTLIIKQQQTNITSAFDFVQQRVLQLISKIEVQTDIRINTIISIPVYYNGEDLNDVACLHGLSVEELIQIHTTATYRVYMTGFLPGFAYMGTVDERIATARKELPRLCVPAGSVGIAGAQTGIYPVDSPGGWQLIGKTPLKIFDQTKKDPCLLKAGDQVKFVSITKTEFEKRNEYQHH